MRMTLGHQSYHVEFVHEEGKAQAEMGPNPGCPYCNEGWTEHIPFSVRDNNIRSYRIQIEKLSPGPYLELFASDDIEARPEMLTSSMPPAGDPYGTGYRMDGKCPGCPHDYHPARVCGVYSSRLDRPCPCGYDVEEEGQDTSPRDVDVPLSHNIARAVKVS